MAEQVKLQKLHNLQNLVFYRQQRQWKLKKPLEPSPSEKIVEVPGTPSPGNITSAVDIEERNKQVSESTKQELDVASTNITQTISEAGKNKEVPPENISSKQKSVSERLRLLLHFHQNTETSLNNSGTCAHEQNSKSNDDSIYMEFGRPENRMNFYELMEECLDEADSMHSTVIDGFIVSQYSSLDEFVCSSDSSCASFIRNARELPQSSPIQFYSSDTSQNIDKHRITEPDPPTSQPETHSFVVTINGSRHTVEFIINKTPDDHPSYTKEHSVSMQDTTTSGREEEIFLAGSGYFLIPSIRKDPFNNVHIAGGCSYRVP